MSVTLKSAYGPAAACDGTRYLAETLWPEGVDTLSLSPYQWIHEIAPSYDLKEMAIWKHWAPEKFRDEYKRELQEPQRRMWLNKVVKETKVGIVTLLHNNRNKASLILPEDTTVYYLKEFIEAELGKTIRLTPQPRALPSTVIDLEEVSIQEMSQWTNEGGQ